MTPKERYDFIKEVAKSYYMANVLNGDNHDKYSDIAAKAVRTAVTLADELDKSLPIPPGEADEVESAKGENPPA